MRCLRIAWAQVGLIFCNNDAIHRSVSHGLENSQHAKHFTVSLDKCGDYLYFLAQILMDFFFVFFRSIYLHLSGSVFAGLINRVSFCRPGHGCLSFADLLCLDLGCIDVSHHHVS